MVVLRTLDFTAELVAHVTVAQRGLVALGGPISWCVFAVFFNVGLKMRGYKSADGVDQRDNPRFRRRVRWALVIGAVVLVATDTTLALLI